MRRTEAELRAILEGVADAVAAEDPDGPARLRQRRRGAPARRRGRASAPRLGIAARRCSPAGACSRASARAAVVATHASHRWSRVKASAGARGRGPGSRSASIEDITEIKQAEEAQRFLAETSRALAGSLRRRATLPEVARLAAAHLAGACVIELDGARSRAPAPGAGAIADARSRCRGGDRAARSRWQRPRRPRHRRGARAAHRRRGRERAPVPHSARRSRRRSSSSLLPPELPEIPGLDSAALYRPAGEGNEVGGDFYDLFPTGERRVVRGHRRRLRQGRRGRRGDRARPLHDPRRGHPPPLTGRHPALAQRGDAAPARRALRDARLRAARSSTTTVDRRPSPAAATRRRACCAPPGSWRRSARTARCSACSPKSRPTDRTARLAPGDALVLYTDGLTEARAPHVLTPGAARHRGRRRAPPQRRAGIVEHLSTQAPDPLRDDLALLAIRVQPLL